MNKFLLLRLLRLDWPALLWMPWFPLFYTLVSMGSVHVREVFFMNSHPGNGVILLYGFIATFGAAYHCLSRVSAQGSATATLEFFFSRAISRRSLFLSLSGLYLFFCFSPLVTVWAYSHTKPELDISLHYAASHRAAEDFYLSRFKGSYLRLNKASHFPDDVCVVLPQGQVDRARFALVWGGVVALLCQATGILVLGRPSRYRLWFVWIALLPILTDVPWFENLFPLSSYESGLAWVHLHPVLSVGGLVLFVFATEAFFLRRFVNTEIRS